MFSETSQHDINNKKPINSLKELKREIISEYHRLQDVVTYRSFYQMDFPFECKDKREESPSKRKTNFLVSTDIYTNEFVEEVDEFNKRDISDKYADGILFTDVNEMKDYPGLSKEMIEKKCLMFPIRLWTDDDPFKGSCIIILGLHLYSNSKSACAIYPIL